MPGPKQESEAQCRITGQETLVCPYSWHRFTNHSSLSRLKNLWRAFVSSKLRYAQPLSTAGGGSKSSPEGNMQQGPNLHALNSHIAQLRPFVTEFKLQKTEDKLIIRKTASHPYLTAFLPCRTPSLDVQGGTRGREAVSQCRGNTPLLLSLQACAALTAPVSPHKSSWSCTLLLTWLTASSPHHQGSKSILADFDV